MKARVSILEDSIDVQQVIEAALLEAGYQVKSYGLAQNFEKDLNDWKPELCILDLGLPDKDGLSMLSQITSKYDTAVLVVSGRSSLSDRIVGLELGADDYLTKPFEVSELVARVRALLRRKQSKKVDAHDKVYSFAGWTIDISKFVLSDSHGETVQVSASEAALLEVFLNRPNRLVTRDYIREQLGDRSDELSFDRAIDVRVSRLRNKLRDPSKESRIIKTVYGAGYILVADVTRT